MDIQKQEEPKVEVEKKTTSQESSADETNNNQLTEEETSQKNEAGEEQGETWTPPTKEEWEKVHKKASDFDGIIEKKRLEKLYKKENGDEGDMSPAKTDDTFNKEEVLKLVKQTVDETLMGQKAESFNKNLADAYRDFVGKNKWADSDEVISKISGNFNAGGSVDKQELLTKLEAAAQVSFPDLYRKTLEDRLRSEILLEKDKIDAGDFGSGSSQSTNTDGEKKLTKEQIELARRCGNDPKEVYSN